MKILLLFVLYIATASALHNISRRSSDYENSTNDATVEVDVYQNLIQMEKEMKSGIKSLLKLLMPKMLESAGSLNLSPQCTKDVLQFITGLRNLRTWSISFIDSSGKIMDGILTGGATSLGIYDQCLDTVAKSSRSSDKGKELFRGQYCMIQIKPILPPARRSYRMQEVLEEVANLTSDEDRFIGHIASRYHLLYYRAVNLGVCVPSGCGVEDMRKVTSTLGKELHIHTEVERCEVKEKWKLSGAQISIIFIYCFFAFLVLIGSLMDTWCRKTDVASTNTCARILLAFSLPANLKKLCNMKTQEERLGCLHGIRNLSLIWIIWTHTYYYFNLNFVQSGNKIFDTMDRVDMQILLSGSLAVEPFFFIGGLLVCYWTVILVKEKKHAFSVPLYVLQRLWRIIPSYYFIYIFMFLIRAIGSGPLFHQTLDMYSGGCHDYWWTSFLFIHNFYKFNHMCMPHAWYVAADLQLYIASLIILIPLLKWPKIGVTLGFFAILLSMVYQGAWTYVNEWTGISLIHADPEVTRTYQLFYYNPLSHAATYVLGMLVGYLLATKKEIKIPKMVQCIGWAVALTLTSTVVYAPQKWQMGEVASVLEDVLVAATFRLAFAVGVAWVVVCCSAGYGGIVNYLLSLKIWIPMTRLSFLVYLIHPISQTCYSANMRTLLNFDHFVILYMSFGHLVASYMLAFLVNMMVEAPFMALQKIVFGARREEIKATHEMQDDLKRNSQQICEVKTVVSPSNNLDLKGEDNKNFISIL